MNAIQTRVVQFAFRSALGKFFKRMGNDQFEGVSIGATRLQFTSNDLEINTDTVNAEVLQGTQIHLASGFINTLVGDFPTYTQSTRRVVLDGIHLTIDFIGTCAATKAPAQQQPPDSTPNTGDQARGMKPSPSVLSVGRDGPARDFLSSMVEHSDQVKRDDAPEAPPTDTSGGGAEDSDVPELGPEDIDECAAALSSTFKALLHNTVGILCDVNLRLRFPPPGHDIVPGQPLPPEAVEVLVHIPRIDVTDSTDIAKALNNSFRKIVRFSGIMVQVYDANTRNVTEGERDMTYELDLGNTVLQGDPIDLARPDVLPTLDDVSELERRTKAAAAAGADGAAAAAAGNVHCLNEFDLLFDDADLERPKWRRMLSINQAHAVLSPAQLVRVMRVAEYFDRAPEGDGSDDADEKTADDATQQQHRPDDGESRSRLVFSDLSVSLLQPGADTTVIANVWHQFNQQFRTPSAGLSKTPHYSVRLSNLQIIATCPMDQVLEDRHPLTALFDAVGGSDVVLSLGGATIVERQPAASSSNVILRLEDCPPDLFASFVFTRRVSFPMSLLRAEKLKVDVGTALQRHAAESGLDERDLRRSPKTRLVREHAFAFMQMPLHIYADVEILDRVLAFSNDVQTTRAKAKTLAEAVVIPPEVIRGADATDGTPFRNSVMQSAATSVNGPMFYSARSDRSPTHSDESFGLGDMSDMKPVTHDDDVSSLDTNDSADLCEESDDGSDGDALAAPAGASSVARMGTAAPASKKHVDPTTVGPAMPGALKDTRKERGVPLHAAGRRGSASYDPGLAGSPFNLGPQLITVASTEVQCVDVDLQLKFPVTRPPPADLYGPDTVRIFQELRSRCVPASRFEEADRGKARSTLHRARVAQSRLSLSDLHGSPTRSSEPSASFGAGGEQGSIAEDGDTLYLPRALVLHFSALSVSLPGDDAVDTETIVVTTEALEVNLRQLDSAPSASESGRIPGRLKRDVTLLEAFSPSSASTQQVKFSDQHPPERRSAPPTISLRRQPKSTLPPLHLQETEIALADHDRTAATQSELTREATTHVDIKVPLVRTGALFRDHYLLLLFMTTELTDCVTGAIDRDETRRQEAAAAMLDKVVLSSMASRKASVASDLSSENSVTNFFLESKGQSVSGGSTQVPTTTVALHVQKVEATVVASRLDADGKPLGEPLLTLLSDSFTADVNDRWHFHRYEAQVQHLSLFVVTQSLTPLCSSMALLVKARACKFSENLPQCPPGFRQPTSSCPSVPPWGSRVTLLESYASLHSKVSAMSPEQLAGRPHVLQVSMRRVYNIRRRTDDMDLNVNLDRMVMTHQPAHDGDHWIFVLLGWTSDIPLGGGAASPAAQSDEDAAPSATMKNAASVSSVESAASPPVVNRTFATANRAAAEAATDAGASPPQAAGQGSPNAMPPAIAAATPMETPATPPADSPQPFLARTNVELSVCDAVLEYLPFGRSERVVLIVPDVTLHTGDLVSGTPKSLMKVFIDAPIAVMMHDKFFQSLLQYDASRGERSVFGTSRGGGGKSAKESGGSSRYASSMREDLELLGFVPLLTLAHKYASRAEAAKDGGSSTMAANQSVANFTAQAASQRQFMHSTVFESGASARFSTNNSVRFQPPSASAAPSAPPKLPAVRLLSYVYDDKPFVVDISGLELEASAAWDSLHLFRTVLQLFGAGADIAHLPAPRMLVASSHRFFHDVATAPTAPVPPPKDTHDTAFAEEHARPTAFVGGVPVLSEDLEDGVDPLADLRDSNGDVMREDTDEVVDTFDMIADDENLNAAARNVAWMPRDYKAPARSKELQAQRVMKHGFNGSVDDLGWSEVHVNSETHQWPQNFLGALFSAPRHFSRANTQFRRRDMDAPSRPLPHCPKSATQVVVSDSSLRLVLCGGSDFVSERRSDLNDLVSGDWDIMVSSHFRSYQKPDGSTFMRSTRADDERVIAELTGLFVQLDIFESGHNMQQRLHVSIQDVSVLDRVQASPARHLLWVTVPPPRRDRPAVEMRWTSFSYSRDPALHPRGSSERVLEEEMAVRLLPLHVNLSRVTYDLLAKFVAAPSASGSDANMGSPDGTASPKGPTSQADAGLFFRRFTFHPLSVKLSWHPDLRDVNALRQGDVLELASILAIEGSSIDLADIVVHACPAAQLPEQLMQAVMPMLYSSRVILLFAGLQPVRTVTEVAGALGELVLTPLEYHHHNKSLYNGIAKGLNVCTRRLAGETLRLASGATRLAHEGVNMAASSAVPNSHADPLMRGNQPEGLAEGASSGAAEVLRGLSGMRVALKNTFNEPGVDSLVKVPLSMLIPVDGALRGMTQFLLGARNALQPERRREEVHEFKSTKFSGKPKQK